MSMIIGLTGGIGSGKSFAAHLFSEQGIPVIDTDQIAHAITAPGGSAIQAITQHFGIEYLTQEGGLDRDKMRQKVFQDSLALAKLNAIMHPLIRSDLDTQTKQFLSAPYIIQIIPLLTESRDWKARVDRVLVIDCPPETQIARVIQRSQLERTEILAIMKQQASREQRLSCANEVLDNHEHVTPSLEEQIHKLHQYYLKFSQH